MTEKKPTKLKWEAPPPDPRGGGRRSHWVPIAEALRERPGDWALIAQGVSGSTGTEIKSGRIPSFRPPGSFEAKVRRTADGKTFDVWARYVGAAS